MIKLKNDDITKDNLFDADRLYSHVKSFSFPRLVGTEGERKAVKLTIETFQNIGFIETQIHKESFEFSDFYSTTLINSTMAVGSGLGCLQKKTSNQSRYS